MAQLKVKDTKAHEIWKTWAWRKVMLENKYGTEWQQSFIDTPGPLAAFHKVSHFLSAIPHQVT